MDKKRREKAAKDIAKLKDTQNDTRIVEALLKARENLKVNLKKKKKLIVLFICLSFFLSFFLPHIFLILKSNTKYIFFPCLNVRT